MEFNLLEDFYTCINLKDLDELMEKINIFFICFTYCII